MIPMPDALPRLSVGSHERGSGQACLMNLISYANGDARITDAPDCTHPVLAKTALWLNDTVCTHRDNSPLLCVECTTVMLGYEPALVGTAAPADPLEAKRLAVALALSMRPLAELQWHPGDAAVCVGAFNAAQAWLDCPCESHRVAAACAEH
ncbi:MAG: hypothetical protein ACRDL8_21725, partial [Solirubrobacteraceae bacterium]